VTVDLILPLLQSPLQVTVVTQEGIVATTFHVEIATG